MTTSPVANIPKDFNFPGYILNDTNLIKINDRAKGLISRADDYDVTSFTSAYSFTDNFGASFKYNDFASFIQAIGQDNIDIRLLFFEYKVPQVSDTSITFNDNGN